MVQVNVGLKMLSYAFDIGQDVGLACVCCWPFGVGGEGIRV